MSAVTTVRPTDTDWIARHAELVAQRNDPAIQDKPGRLASAARKLAEVEMELEISGKVAGVDYEPWNPPTKSAATLASMDTDALVKAHTDAVAARSDDSIGSGKKASLTGQIKSLEVELDKRDGAKYVKWSGANRVPAMDDETLLRRIHAVRALIARGAAVSPRVMRVAQREISTLEALASNRSLSVSNGVAPSEPIEPTQDAGSMLDAVEAGLDSDAIAEMSAPTPTRSRKRTR